MSQVRAARYRPRTVTWLNSQPLGRSQCAGGVWDQRLRCVPRYVALSCACPPSQPYQGQCVRKRRTGYAELRPYEAVLHPGDVYVLRASTTPQLGVTDTGRGSAGFTSLPTGFTR
jgi:hypothetical protein